MRNIRPKHSHRRAGRKRSERKNGCQHKRQRGRQQDTAALVARQRTGCRHGDNHHYRCRWSLLAEKPARGKGENRGTLCGVPRP